MIQSYRHEPQSGILKVDYSPFRRTIRPVVDSFAGPEVAAIIPPVDF